MLRRPVDRPPTLREHENQLAEIRRLNAHVKALTDLAISRGATFGELMGCKPKESR